MEKKSIKVIILGSTGMIGHKLTQVLSNNQSLQLYNISKSRLNNETLLIDFFEIDDLICAIKNIQPQIIVNAAGILIEDSELRPIDSLKLNAMLPLTLNALSKKLSFKLIQISTDCVFSGKNGPYSVSDAKDASNVYGKTKALGEIIGQEHLTIRTSVIGPDLYMDGMELFNWFVTQNGRINGFSSSMWSGVTTLELARCVEYCILNEIKGLNHLTSGTPISKYELLKIIKKQLKKKISINEVDKPVNNKVLLPENSFFYAEPQDYNELIKNMISDINASGSYPHYDFLNI